MTQTKKRPAIRRASFTSRFNQLHLSSRGLAVRPVDVPLELESFDPLLVLVLPVLVVLLGVALPEEPFFR